MTKLTKTLHNPRKDKPMWIKSSDGEFVNLALAREVTVIAPYEGSSPKLRVDWGAERYVFYEISAQVARWITLDRLNQTEDKP